MLDMTEDRERDRDRGRRSDIRRGGRDDSRDRSRERLQCRRIYVSNIPYEYRWQDLKDLFRKEVGDVAFVELFSDESNKPRGCGIVEFDKADSVGKALEKMNRFELNGRNLVVKEDFGNERDKFGRVLPKGVTRDRDGERRGGGGGGGGGGYRDLDDRLLVLYFIDKLYLLLFLLATCLTGISSSSEHGRCVVLSSLMIRIE